MLGAGKKKQDVIPAFKEFLFLVEFPLPTPAKTHCLYSGLRLPKIALTAVLYTGLN